MIDRVQWLGHAGFRINGETVIYIDPYHIKGGEKADVVLVSHGHYDHCSPGDIDKIRKDDTVIVAAASAAGKLTGDARVLRPGETVSIKGVTVEGVPAYNVNKQFHPRVENNLGFIITVDSKRIYHAGDTDLIPEMKSVKADIALLPAGGTYTMDAEEAARAAGDINPEIAVPMHWGSVAGSRKDAERFQQLCETEARILEISSEYPTLLS